MLQLIQRLLPALLLAILSPSALASDEWMRELGTVAIQDGGRVMPLDGFARRLATNITGREHWSAGRGPEAYSGRHHMQLLCDLLFKGQDVIRVPLIAEENKPFKRLVGLDPEQRFFSAMDVAGCQKLTELLQAFEAARHADPGASPSRDQRRALDLFSAANRIAGLGTEPLAIVPGPQGKAFLTVSLKGGEMGTEQAREALNAIGKAYRSDGPMDAPVAQLRTAIDAAGTLHPAEARNLRLELLYDRHNPWRMTQLLYGLAIVLFGLSRLMLRRPLVVLAVLATVAGIAEHLLGVGLRIAILDRAPVSNTFESLLWMGLVAIAIGVTAQVANRKGYYLFGGVCAAFASVLFAGLVPLTDRTNSLPAVLRSNYWLIVHVLTIVASYGVLAVGAVLGHAYLAREVLFVRKSRFVAEGRGPVASHPLIAQTYRTIQIGLLLLTAGTILGGVWAADSWGRFWGWDPKETWALISIVVYFTVLHARYVRWLRDFGLAASAILGFVVIVWTFYGVNYVMASGLHSYGFGSGGEVWVALWAGLELVFLIACKIRYNALAKGTPPQEPTPTTVTAGA